MQGRSPLRPADPEDRVAAVMAEHGRTLLRTANHFSLCHDDALDAYQRGLEIFLRRADRVLPETEVAWLKVVVKHEALSIRRSRSESVDGEEVDFDARTEPTARPLDEQVASGERVSRSAEALRALKPDERRALMLKAQGYSYEEIGSHLGWTYTKVNRAITEGRRRFMKVFQAIESGEACEQYTATIAALAGGTASSADVVEIRPHLRHCSACRATVRRLHVPAGTRIKLLLPGFLLAPARRAARRGGATGRAHSRRPPDPARGARTHPRHPPRPAQGGALRAPASHPGQRRRGRRLPRHHRRRRQALHDRRDHRLLRQRRRGGSPLRRHRGRADTEVDPRRARPTAGPAHGREACQSRRSHAPRPGSPPPPAPPRSSRSPPQRRLRARAPTRDERSKRQPTKHRARASTTRISRAAQDHASSDSSNCPQLPQQHHCAKLAGK